MVHPGDGRVVRVVRGSVRHSRSVFFFQAEDGIRDKLVTGVQTCALPISHRVRLDWVVSDERAQRVDEMTTFTGEPRSLQFFVEIPAAPIQATSVDQIASRRSEEHTSELQSLAYLVCRLLLKKKKKKIQ